MVGHLGILGWFNGSAKGQSSVLQLHGILTKRPFGLSSFSGAIKKSLL